MVPSGITFKEYAVTVTGMSGNVVPVTGSTSFILKVLNPCQFNTMTSIMTPAIDNPLFQYKIDIGMEGTVA